MVTNSPNPLKQDLLNGALGRCPVCGDGKLFSSYLKIVPACLTCGEEFHHHRADDMPAYYVIMIVGHVVVLTATAVEVAFTPAYWVHMALWVPFITLMTLGLLPPVKGMIVALQWRLGMHGFAEARKLSASTPATMSQAQAAVLAQPPLPASE